MSVLAETDIPTVPTAAIVASSSICAERHTVYVLLLLLLLLLKEALLLSPGTFHAHLLPPAHITVLVIIALLMTSSVPVLLPYLLPLLFLFLLIIAIPLLSLGSTRIRDCLSPLLLLPLILHALLSIRPPLPHLLICVPALTAVTSVHVRMGQARVCARITDARVQ